MIRLHIDNEVVYSEPIKSVSKPEQIRQKIAVRDGKEMPKRNRKKRTRTDELLETLYMIRKTQEEHSRLLHELFSVVRRPECVCCGSRGGMGCGSAGEGYVSRGVTLRPDGDVGDHGGDVGVYFDPVERVNPAKVRRVMHSESPGDAQIIMNSVGCVACNGFGCASCGFW